MTTTIRQMRMLKLRSGVRTIEERSPIRPKADGTKIVGLAHPEAAEFQNILAIGEISSLTRDFEGLRFSGN